MGLARRRDPGPPGNPLLSLLPILVTGILFGLAMDYQVFLVSRMHEAHVAGAPPRDAIVAGFRRSAVVVAAAVTDLPADGTEPAAARVLADVDEANARAVHRRRRGVPHHREHRAAVFPNDATTGRDLNAAADAAMYARRRRGGSGRRSAM